MDEPFERRGGHPLPPSNWWGLYSFILYQEPTTYQLFPGIHPPNGTSAVTPPTLTAAAVMIGGFFHLFTEVTNITPKRKQQKDGPEGKANITVFLFDM